MPVATAFFRTIILYLLLIVGLRLTASVRSENWSPSSWC